MIYEGKRKAVKINPNTSVMNIIQDVKREFNLPESCNCQLKHKKTILDSSQPFRFLGIPLNAEIDVVISSGTSTAGIARLAISVEGFTQGSFTESFPSTLTLQELLIEMKRRGKIHSDIMELEPEVIYIRQKFCGEQLAITTLYSMGLSG